LQEVLVYTPPDYETTTERYPVIYWLADWLNGASNLPVPDGMDEAIQARKIPPVIVVSLSSSIKAGGSIFTGTTFLNSHEFGNWEDFLIQELIPFIDKSY
jgi:enterochelin esterase-like enzyme